MPVSLSTPLKRQVQLHGVPTPINLILNSHGIEMSVAGTRTRVFGSWEQVAKSLHIPSNAPSIYHGRALDYLKSLAGKAVTRKEKKETDGR